MTEGIKATIGAQLEASRRRIKAARLLAKHGLLDETEQFIRFAEAFVKKRL